MKPALKRDFLIALMRDKRDFKIAQEQHWYRIPVKTKQAPKSVIDKSLRHIAFYHTNVFGQNAHSIRWYGEVKNISIVKRKELLPELPNDPKAEHLGGLQDVIDQKVFRYVDDGSQQLRLL